MQDAGFKTRRALPHSHEAVVDVAVERNLSETSVDHLTGFLREVGS